MSKYIEKDTPSGVIGYDMAADDTTGELSASVSAYRGRDVEIHIPAYIDAEDGDVPVKTVGRKAFLSDRYLHSIYIPDTVGRIEEWAFAGCRSLESITLPRGIIISNGTFKDCVSLEQVRLYSVEDAPDAEHSGDAGASGDASASAEQAPGAYASGQNSADDPDTGFLLAAAVRLMEDRYLFDLNEAGSLSWFENWDMRMDSILNEPDEEGFSALLACGEEDYEGRDNTIEAYLERRRRRKVRICLVRLMNDKYLSDAHRERLVTYIYDHRAGTAHPDSWKTVLEEHGDEEEYYRVLRECGCFDSGNIDIMLEDLGDAHAGMKAYLIRTGSELTGGGFLDSMDL